MGGEVRWRAGPFGAVEIGGRCDHRHAHRRPDLHGDHVPLDLLPEPDAGVEAPGDDIQKAGVGGDLDDDVRIVGEQRR